MYLWLLVMVYIQEQELPYRLTRRLAAEEGFRNVRGSSLQRRNCAGNLVGETSLTECRPCSPVQVVLLLLLLLWINAFLFIQQCASHDEQVPDVIIVIIHCWWCLYGLAGRRDYVRQATSSLQVR